MHLEMYNRLPNSDCSSSLEAVALLPPVRHNSEMSDSLAWDMENVKVTLSISILGHVHFVEGLIFSCLYQNLDLEEVDADF